eukprot:CAMPEP_0177757494 /NCGR_PEP_ID=MMETSP0491_2-20121128/3672_1 /TAXON_ID=63592 /ORGANISM="Tetraselmis chuii, Strain PLY429" /LENGTH=458 /DNA_ID=CAMNT_0019273147 /DNA_START=405 /DNA_END=1781 /DNA_ORIENTATION=+
MMSGNHYRNGSVSISLDKYQYRPGETVNGYVSLTVTGPLSCSDLNLRFRGEARTRVRWTETEHYTDSEGKSQTRQTERSAEESVSLCALTTPLAHFPDGSIHMGHYQFPFSLPLPSGLPAAFAVQYPRSSACVFYAVSVKLKRPGIFTWDIQERVVVDLVAPVPAHLANPQEQVVDDVQQVRSCCCINKGQVRLSAYLNKQAYFTSEPYDFSWQVTNGSTTDVERVTASLVKRGAITARGNTDYIEDTGLHSRTISSGHGLRRAASKKEDATRSLEKSSPEWHTETMAIGPDITPTIDHYLVRFGYGLKLKAEMSGTCITSPSVELPVFIFREAPIPMSSWQEQAAQYDDPESILAFGFPAPYQPDPAAKPSPTTVASSGWMDDREAAAPAVVQSPYGGGTAAGYPTAPPPLPRIGGEDSGPFGRADGGRALTDGMAPSAPGFPAPNPNAAAPSAPRI